MGLPQVSSRDGAEQVAATSLGSFLKSPPRLAGVSTCDLDGIHGGRMIQTVMDTPCSSIAEFQRKASLEISEFFNGSFKSRGPTDVLSNVHGLKIASAENAGLFTPKNEWNSRIVGFESNGTSSLSKELEDVSAEHVHSSSVDGVTVECSRSLVRKRLLSPVKSMLSTDHFNGDPLDISFSNSQIHSPTGTHSSGVPVSQDYKKVNVGSKIHYTTLSWSSCLEQKSVPFDNSNTASTFFTEGPLLEKNDAHSCSNFLGMGYYPFGLSPLSPFNGYDLVKINLMAIILPTQKSNQLLDQIH